MGILRKCILLQLVLLAGGLFGQDTSTPKAIHRPRPLPGKSTTFSIKLDGPYKDYREVADNKKEASVKKGKLFMLNAVMTNTADEDIVIPLFGGESGSVLEIRDSAGKSVIKCPQPRKLAGPLLGGIVAYPLNKGEVQNQMLQFGSEAQCFQTDVPGKYTFRLHVPDEYTGRVVDSNKLTIKVTE